MNGTLLDSLPSASRISGNGDFSFIVKVLSSTACHLADGFHQLLAERVALAPAFERGDAIGGAHRLAVMPFQAVAQDEAVGQLVVADRPAIDHLRLRLEILVEREQRVEDQIAEIAGDIGRRPDRVDAAQIRLRDEAQGLRRGLGLCRRRGHAEPPATTAAAMRNRHSEHSDQAVIDSPVEPCLPPTLRDPRAGHLRQCPRQQAGRSRDAASRFAPASTASRVSSGREA